MKKLVLLIILGPGIFEYAFSQPIAAFEALSISADTSLISKSHQKQRILPDTKKAVDNPTYSFKDLFEVAGPGISPIAGPRLNPRALSFVQDYIETNAKGLVKMKDWARPFFSMMDGIFVQNGLPLELKYLAVIESRLNPVSVSWAGAVGPWQFMPSTAIRMGLKVNRYKDERKHYVKSTEAAARYLRELYEQFGDWLLVIAAYNGGPGNVLKAIRRSGSRNFWDIQYYLPAESRNHVKKFIGTHYIFEGQGGLTTLTRAETTDHYGSNGIYVLNRVLSPAEAADARELTISGKYHSRVIAGTCLMELSDFNRYNPEFDKVMAGAGNSYQLKLPTGKMELFVAHKYQILNESIKLLLTNAATMSEISKNTSEKKSPGKKVRSGK